VKAPLLSLLGVDTRDPLDHDRSASDDLQRFPESAVRVHPARALVEVQQLNLHVPILPHRAAADPAGPHRDH